MSTSIQGAPPTNTELEIGTGEILPGAPAQQTELLIEGMTCASCVGRIERALSRMPGVQSASVNLATERATVRHDLAQVTAGDLESAVRRAGYEARRVDVHSEVTSAGERRADELVELRRSLTLAGALTIPIATIEMGAHFYEPLHHWLHRVLGHEVLMGVLFVLASLVQFGPGLRFFKKGVPALFGGAPDMNSLVVLGTTAAYGYSVVATFAPGVLPGGTANVYFEASALIVTLVLLGRYFEARSKGRASDAIRHLMDLSPKKAWVFRDEDWQEISVEAVVVGDRVRVRPGDRIAVDGSVEEGSSYVDESMVTGEPVPVLKAAVADVVGGTLNSTGTFAFTAKRVGRDTVLSQIVRMVESAQAGKLPIQALVDKVTSWFVPVVMTLAAITFGVWWFVGPDPALTFALVNAVAVLIIACPCAMGLATPTSIMVGTGRAAELGILFRKGEALQALEGVDTLVFDKTGTITKGRPELTDLVLAEGFSEDAVLALAAAVEAPSEHPLARAIVEAAERRDLRIEPVEGFEATPGFGVSGRVAGHDVQLGADRYVRELGLDPEPFRDDTARLASESKSPLFVVIDGRVAGLLAISDPIKPGAAAAIGALEHLGLKVVMLTGDHRATAEVVAGSVGIVDVVAEVLPAGKLEAIARLRAAGRRVAFVGDGINDAPALAEADVGIAMGAGTDIAIESADVVLMSGDLRGVPSAVALSRATLRNIKQNLFWAFAYNASLIPVAAGALYPAFGLLLSPVFAAGAMALSSVFVVGNALRLRAFEAEAPAV